MTRRRWLVAIAIIAVLSLLWAVPTLAGPNVVCGPTVDAETCAEIRPQVIHYGAESYRPLPVTRVYVKDATLCEGSVTYAYFIEQNWIC